MVFIRQAKTLRGRSTTQQEYWHPIRSFSSASVGLRGFSRFALRQAQGPCQNGFRLRSPNASIIYSDKKIRWVPSCLLQVGSHRCVTSPQKGDYYDADAPIDERSRTLATKASSVISS